MVRMTEKQRQERKRRSVNVLNPGTGREYGPGRSDVFSCLQQPVEQAENEIDQEAWLVAVEEARSEIVNE